MVILSSAQKSGYLLLVTEAKKNKEKAIEANMSNGNRYPLQLHVTAEGVDGEGCLLVFLGGATLLLVFLINQYKLLTLWVIT